MAVKQEYNIPVKMMITVFIEKSTDEEIVEISRPGYGLIKEENLSHDEVETMRELVKRYDERVTG